MTIIVTDGITVSANTLIRDDGIKLAGAFNKIVEENGVVYALAGPHVLFPSLMYWYQHGADSQSMPPEWTWSRATPDNTDWDLNLLVFDKGELFKLTRKFPYFHLINAPAAIGSDRGIALGAMEMGATPEQAVAAAIKWGINNAGGDIQNFQLGASLHVVPQTLTQRESQLTKQIRNP